MKHFLIAANIAIALLTIVRPTANAATWIGPSSDGSMGGVWTAASNWSPAAVPNATRAAVVFNADNTSSGRAISGATGTVGSISFDTTSDPAHDGVNSLGGALTLDQTTGPATITVTGNGTKLTTITAPLTLTDSLTINAVQTTSASNAGAITFTGGISGPGGVTKLGDGTATFGTSAKSYTGPTVLNGGRMRVSSVAGLSSTSSLTINAGAQLTLISTATYTFGSGPLNLNGVGAVSGPSAAFPGAIRNDRGLDVTITNAVNLQSDSLVHVQANVGTGGNSPVGSLTFSGIVSGVGKLVLTAPGASSVDEGFLKLTNKNTYSGGTLVAGGIVHVMGADATLGTGNVEVNNASAPATIAKLLFEPGVANAIADYATLSLAGGGAPGSPDQGFLEFEGNETVGGLILGGVVQGVGTYGGSTSGATFQSDDYFAGSGVLTVALPGDFNHDGKVDGADFAQWTGHFGPANAGSDADHDGDSDGFDFLVWQRKFGAVSPSAAHVVPEPAAALMAAIAVIAAAAGHRRIRTLSTV